MMRLQEITNIDEKALKSVMLSFSSADEGSFIFKNEKYKVFVRESEIRNIYFNTTESLFDLVTRWEYCDLFINNYLVCSFEDGS